MATQQTLAPSSSFSNGPVDLPCWCGGGQWALKIRSRRFRILYCTACGSCRTDPPPIHSAEESASFYTEYYETVGADPKALEDPSQSMTSGYWRVSRQFPSVAEVKGRVADIGCGDGHLCAELKAKGWAFVAGIDISRSRVLRAQKLYPQLLFYSCPLPETGIPKESLDLIIMEAVIEHLPAPLAELGKLVEYLAPGGRIVLTTPNMDSGELRLLGRRWTGMLAPHAHVFLYSVDSIRKLLLSAELQPECVGSYFTPLYTPKDYLRRIARGDIKGTLWRAHQELGAVYGRLIGSGPMLFAVGRKL